MNNNLTPKSEIRFTFRSFDHNILDQFLVEFTAFLRKHDLEDYSVVMMPLQKKIFPLIKAVFVHKKHREHFEIRTYTRLLIIRLKETDSLFNIRNYHVPDLIEIYKVESLR